MSNHPDHHRMPDRGERARATTFPSINPSTIQIPPSRGFFPKRDPGDASFDHQPLHHRPQRGQDCNWDQRDQRLIPPQPPSLSLDCGFKSDRSSVLTALSVSLQSDRLEGSQCSWCGRQCRETRAHMKINLPIFKDEDAKDTITYQNWRWDMNIYHHVGCQDHTLLP